MRIDMQQAAKTVKIVGINGRFTHSCLALFYVRNELEKHSDQFSCQIVQYTINDNYYEMLLQLAEGQPEYIFFSAAIWNSSLVEKLIADLATSLPECKVVVGGPQAEIVGIASDQPNLTIVLGEIEGIEKGFYQDLEQANLLKEYKGSFFDLQESRSYDFPYRDHDLAHHFENRHIYYESSRGCPFSCSYCLSASERRVYHKEISEVKDELRQILRYHPKIIRFIDRTFNDMPARALEIWNFLEQEGQETLFHFEMAPDRFTEEMFDFLATLPVGRFQFEIGIQSTNEKTLDSINRKVDRTKVARCVERLASFKNIHLHVDLILGLPYETQETFAKSFMEVFRMGANYIQMGLLKILPNTPICSSVEEFGYLQCKQAPYSILANRWMDHSTLQHLYWFSECVEKFYNNRYFVSFWSYIRRHQEDVFEFFNKLLSLCQKSGFFQFAPTQELLCEKLVELISARSDKELLLEILRYDWLKCNHRFLPDCLQVQIEGESPQKLRSELYQSMPHELAGAYNKATRNQFFRKSYFLRISQKCAEEIDIAVNTERPCLCFLPSRQNTLHKHNKVLVLH